ncbi:MAG: phosphate ABC transporter ATP-binding protein [Peptococcaceae bacterium]|nr:phosphate ABC transporter ATP-binding protein [Peptococcaceae bacterium]
MIVLDRVSLSRKQGGVEKKVLSLVSMCVTKGEIYTIIGPSGSGKSTLLRVINRLITASAGTVMYEGKNICDIPVTELRRKVGMVFQQPVLFPGTVESNILYGPKLNHSEVVPLEYLRMVGLPEELLHRDVNKLSGGQQQRVSLARSLANKPDVLLLDEPTSALDIRSTEQLEEMINKLVQELQLTVVWVTHNLEQAQRVGKTTLLLVNGQVVEEQNTNEFFLSPQSNTTVEFLAGKLLTGGIE